jgi:hypothetical protein
MALELARRLRFATKDEVRASYEDLVNLPCEDPHLSRVGAKVIDHFFLHHRLKAKTKAHLSFYDAIRDPKRRAHLSELVLRYRKKDPKSLTPDGLLKLQYAVFQLYYGTINMFRPASAKWIYCQLNPQVGILDFSAGWGGRALAAMSMGIPYYGIDANTNMEPAYRNMVQFLDPNARVTMTFAPSESVDFSKYKYDLVFTSPPYFMLEEYEKMPAYKSKQGFLDIFFKPVVQNAWEHLLPGGNMALNMPEEMYDAVKHLLPPLHRTLLLPLKNRHASDAVHGHKLGKTNKDEDQHEYIYVWRKPEIRKMAKAKLQTRKLQRSQRNAFTRKN